jgi:hypothetical protein
MKLCPQCDFIYEDEQSFCDMDGKALVFQRVAAVAEADVAPLASASKDPRPRAKRWLILIAGIALLLAVIAVAYLVQWRESRRVYAAESSIPPIASDISPQPISIPVAKPAAPETASVSENTNANVALPEASAKMLANSVAANSVNAGLPANNSSAPVIVRLTNGAAITADEAWQGKNGIWYRQGGMVTFLKRSQVQAIERRPALRRPAGPVTDKVARSTTQTASAPNRLRLRRLEPATPKRPSRVTSFFRKTGDILKKPFKL